MTTDTATAERRERKLGVIKGLLDKANNNPFGEEAANCRAKAEDLMVAYRISEWEVAQLNKDTRTKPELRTITIVKEDDNQVKPYIIDLFSLMCNFCHCRAVYWGLTGPGQCTAKVVGYPEDIEYLDMMFTSVELHFSGELDPHVEPGLSRGENIYRMKAAGLKWEQIFTRLGLPFKDMMGNKTEHHSTLMREYTHFCRDNHLEPISANPKTWVRNFAEGYVTKVGQRIIDIQQQQSVARMNEEERLGEKYALVLRDRDQMVDDAYREHFPEVHTVRNSGGRVGKRLADANAQGSHAGSKADIGTGGSIRNTRKELGS